MRKIFLYIIVFNLSLSAQTNFSSWEIGAFGGLSYYLGEVNNNHFQPINYAYGPIVRYNYDQRLNFKFAFTRAEIAGDDSKSNSSFNRDRNFSFKSQISEVSAIAELNFFGFSALDPKSYIVAPYGYLGFAYAHHNPQASYNGILIGTSNLSTEGNTYSKHLFTIPMGMGIKIRMNRFGLAVDWGIRKTFTDYLDDVSTFYLPPNSTNSDVQKDLSNTTQYDDVSNKKRGDQYTNDWYVFTGLTLFVNLTKKDVCPSFK